MRYTPEHKAETRDRILKAASKRFRERGFADAGVASIMRDAGLTHGGFYAHFGSKDDLVASVIRSGFDRVSDRFESRFDGLEGDAWLRAWVEAYLGDGHVAHVAEGCPMPALASDIARSGEGARGAFTEIFEERLAKVSRRVSAPREEAERRVLAAISQMAGALMLARALDEPMSARVRRAAADEAYATLAGGGAGGDS